MRRGGSEAGVAAAAARLEMGENGSSATNKQEGVDSPAPPLPLLIAPAWNREEAKRELEAAVARMSGHGGVLGRSGGAYIVSVSLAISTRGT